MLLFFLLSIQRGQQELSGLRPCGAKANILKSEIMRGCGRNGNKFGGQAGNGSGKEGWESRKLALYEKMALRRLGAGPARAGLADKGTLPAASSRSAPSLPPCPEPRASLTESAPSPSLCPSVAPCRRSPLGPRGTSSCRSPRAFRIALPPLYSTILGSNAPTCLLFPKCTLPFPALAVLSVPPTPTCSCLASSNSISRDSWLYFLNLPKCFPGAGHAPNAQ